MGQSSSIGYSRDSSAKEPLLGKDNDKNEKQKKSRIEKISEKFSTNTYSTPGSSGFKRF